MGVVVGERSRVWTQQPPVGTPIDWSNPLCKGLVFAYEGSAGQQDVAQNRPGSALPAGATVGVGKYGIQENFNGSAVASFGSLTNLAGATEATWDILFYRASGSSVVNLFGQWGSNNGWLIQANVGSTVWVAADDNAGNRRRWDGILGTGWIRLTLSWRGGSNMSVLQNGVNVTASYSAINAVATSIGTTMDNLAVSCDNGGSVVFARAWQRGMQLNEMMSLHNFPWQIFQPSKRRIYIPSSSGGFTTGISWIGV